MANLQLVVFDLNGEEYGIDALAVNGILRHQKFSIHRVPGMPEVIEGMIDLRGKINYIFNLGVKFGCGKTTLSEESKLVMLNVRDSIAGCIVDEVTDIVTVDEKDIQTTPVFLENVRTKYLKGIVKIDDRMIIILIPELILSAEEYEAILSGR